MLNRALLAAAVLSVNGFAFAGPGACTYTGAGICFESTTYDIQKECDTQRGGVFGTTCATENRLGTCAFVESEDKVFVRFYNGTVVENPEKDCAENGGAYTPG